MSKVVKIRVKRVQATTLFYNGFKEAKPLALLKYMIYYANRYTRLCYTRCNILVNASLIILHELEYVPLTCNSVLYHHYQSRVWLHHQNQLCSRIGCNWMDVGTFAFPALSKIQKILIKTFMALI